MLAMPAGVHAQHSHLRMRNVPTAMPVLYYEQVVPGLPDGLFHERLKLMHKLPDHTIGLRCLR